MRGLSGAVPDGAHFDSSKWTEGAPKAAVFPLGLPKFPQMQPSRRDYPSVSNPHSSGSIAIQNQVLSSEVRTRKGEDEDLIPRKCSTNLPARCRKTIGLPTGFLPPSPSGQQLRVRSFSPQLPQPGGVNATLCRRAASASLSLAAASPPSTAVVSREAEEIETPRRRRWTPTW